MNQSKMQHNYIAIVMLPTKPFIDELRATLVKFIDSASIPHLLHATLLYAPLKSDIKLIDVKACLKNSELFQPPIKNIVITEPYVSSYNTSCLAIAEQTKCKQVHLRLANNLADVLHENFTSTLAAPQINYDPFLKTSNIGYNYHAHITLGPKNNDLITQLIYLRDRVVSYKYCLCDATANLRPIHYFN